MCRGSQTLGGSGFLSSALASSDTEHTFLLGTNTHIKKHMPARLATWLWKDSRTFFQHTHNQRLSKHENTDIAILYFLSHQIWRLLLKSTYTQCTCLSSNQSSDSSTLYLLAPGLHVWSFQSCSCDLLARCQLWILLQFTHTHSEYRTHLHERQKLSLIRLQEWLCSQVFILASNLFKLNQTILPLSPLSSHAATVIYLDPSPSSSPSLPLALFQNIP